jgi:hypothetical protein
MKQNYRKIVFWLAGTAAYFLAVAAVLGMLFDRDVAEFKSRSSLTDVEHSEDVQSMIEKLDAAQSARGVLMPIGPDDSYLPGLPEIWEELIKVADFSSLEKDVNGFDGLQAVRSISELGRGAVTEVFLSDQPVSVTRADNVLLVLNDDGQVQVIDCEYPRTPVLLDPLPYPPVAKMVVEGTKAFLLLKKRGQQNGEIVVLDLSEIEEVEELARLTLPAPVVNFFFFHGQLLTYENDGGQKQDQYLNLYNLTDDYELQLRKKIKSPIIDNSAIFVGQLLVTPDLRDGLNVIDMNGLQEPLPIVTLPLNGRIRRLARFGDRFFALGTKGQLDVVDLQNLESPVHSRQITGANHFAYYLHLGDYSYYFSDNGYLRVYDTPITQLSRFRQNSFVPLQGTLAETSDRQSLLFLGDYSNFSHDLDVLPDNFGKITDVVATTPWGEYIVLLDHGGGLSFLRTGKDGRLSLAKRVVLPKQSRWLAAGDTYLYAGGSSLEVIGYADSGEIAHLGSAASPIIESSDGVVIEESLFVAAGRQGIRQFSLKDPSQPESFGVIKLPSHLESFVDVRQLGLHGKRLLAAAGPAGLIMIVPGPEGGLFEGSMIFKEPLSALTTVNGFCLASDKQSVHVIDLRREGSLQKLGEISFLGVERFVVASNGLWAGLVPGEGWTILPAPSIVTPLELNELISTNAFSDKEVARYRLRLFDDSSVVGIPGVLSMAALSEVELSGEGHVDN